MRLIYYRQGVFAFIDAADYADTIKYAAGFFNGNCAFLRRVRLIDLYHCNPAFFGRVFLCHIKINRCAVKHIAVGRLYLYNRVALTVRQFFGRYETAVCIGVKGVNRCRRGIGKGHCYEFAVRVVYLKGCACIRYIPAGFCVHLDYLDIAFKAAVVDKITVSLFILRNEYIKVLHQLTTFPACGLMHGVYAVGHILCLPEAVFIADDNIPLVLLRSSITSCGLEVDFKGRTAFRRFNFGFAIIGMFDDSNIALYNLLVHIVFGLIVLNSIELRVCSYLMDSGIKQITLGRSDFTDCPVITADIFFCGELSVLICGIGVNQFFSLVNAVNRSLKCSIALCRAFFTIALCHSYGELFKNICHIAACDLFPLNRHGLIFRNNITDSRIHFLDSIGCFA